MSQTDTVHSKKLPENSWFDWICLHMTPETCSSSIDCTVLTGCIGRVILKLASKKANNSFSPWCVFLTQTSSKVETSELGAGCFRVNTSAQANNPTAIKLEIIRPRLKGYENNPYEGQILVIINKPIIRNLFDLFFWIIEFSSLRLVPTGTVGTETGTVFLGNTRKLTSPLPLSYWSYICVGLGSLDGSIEFEV